MDLSEMLNNVNWVAVAVSVVVSMVWSFVWYSSSLAGKPWMEAVEVKAKDIEKAYVSRIMPLVLVTSSVGAFTLNVVLADTQGWFDGLFDGAVLGVGLAASQILFLYAFALRPFKLMWIDATWVIVEFALIGLTVGILN